MMKQRNIQNTTVAFSVLTLIIAVGLYVYMYEATDNLITRTLEARRTVATGEATRAQEAEMAKLYETTKEQRDRLSSYFAPSENAVTVIQAIESINDLSGASVEFSSIKANSPADAKGKIGQVTASVKVNGQWKNVMRAVELFETLPYQKNIRNFSLNGMEVGEIGKRSYRWESTFDISIATVQKI